MKVWVKPGAKSCQVVAVDADGVHVRVAAPPREGEANAKLVEFIADVIGVRPRKIAVVQGHKSREKTLSIEDTKREDVETKVLAAVQPE